MIPNLKWICRRNTTLLEIYPANPGTEVHFYSTGCATTYKPDGTCLMPSQLISEEDLLKLMSNNPAWDLIDPDTLMDVGL
jgi:hypothetical protein